MPQPKEFRFKEVGSTNDEAKHLLEAGESECIVISDTQTNGRGQHGRVWESTPGGLYISFGSKNIGLSQEDIPSITQAVGKMVVSITKRLTQIPVELEWPNDIILGIKKVGGILIECNSSASQTTPNYVIIGIGLNLNQTQFSGSLEPVTTSLRLYGNTPVDKETFITELTKEIPNACQRN
ncbi:MAG: biotin--[acetyl-CoA-carboxylase] ligase [bacterium]|nr:biotin--[acetyl-CoA-carboxylase] ligase [bacterium]